MTLASPLCGTLTLVFAGASLIALLALHLLPTGLAPQEHAVSEYGIGRYRLGYRAMTLAMGAAGTSAAVGVATAFPVGGRTVAVILLAVFAACRLAISWFPMDPPGTTTPTPIGAAHVALAIGAFVSAPFAASRMYRGVSGLAGYGGYATALQVAVWVSGASVVGMLLLRRGGLRRWFGAIERLVYLGIFVLLFATGAVML